MSLKIKEMLIPVGKVIKMNSKDKDGKNVETTITRRSGKKIDWQYITIHNTGNPTSSPTGEVKWLTNPDNQRSASFNYVVDADEIIMAIPPTEQSYHAGTGEGNLKSIGIEICESGDHNKNMIMASKLCAELLHSKGFGIDRLTTHKSWSGKNCPRLILPIWTTFVQMVKNELHNIEREKDKDYATLVKEAKTKSEALDYLLERENKIRKLKNYKELINSQVDLLYYIYKKFEVK